MDTDLATFKWWLRLSHASNPSHRTNLVEVEHGGGQLSQSVLRPVSLMAIPTSGATPPPS
ncbi:hypothetical protein E2562_021458 [Oryza meyeriana var. granulata]|uniref:Uncharacterized protein n=1 Tax=Oryza meyeriana var. granulata TaxID=110450 RepID=A0A6G1C9M1_9ORYZ|nr:hypothetical protein E2562_021458 [Oryza meyeriana var. granulata]